MAISVHGNGKHIKLQPAMAVFLTIMGFVFLLDAESKPYALAAATAVFTGLIWYYIATHFHNWLHHD